MRKRTITEGIGWYGLIAILGAYALTNLGYLHIGTTSYRLLNLTGAVALMVDSWPDRNWQIIILNLTWAAIAIIALLQ